MTPKMSLAAVIPLAFASNLFGSPNVAAADRFGVVGIENATLTTISFQHRWGDGQWVEEVISPGARKWYWWEYQQANEDSSPPFNVRVTSGSTYVDLDGHSGNGWFKYTLGKYRAPVHDWNYAHKYVFRDSRNKPSGLELFDEE
jgi:hypothetical protein